MQINCDHLSAKVVHILVGDIPPKPKGTSTNFACQNEAH